MEDTNEDKWHQLGETATERGSSQDPDHHFEIPTEDASIVLNAFVHHFAAAR